MTFSTLNNNLEALATFGGMAKDIIKVMGLLNWSDKKLLRHIDFRSHAQYRCCFEFNYNIAFHINFSEKTVRNSKKRLLKYNLIEKTYIRLGRFKKVAYILTELGKIILSFLLKKYTISQIIKEINSVIYHKYLLSIFKNILGSNGKESGKQGLKEGENSQKEREDYSKGMVDNKPPPDNYRKVWQLKRNLYIKLLKKGWKLEEKIMDEFNLWDYSAL